jgi:hypothetical protein
MTKTEALSVETQLDRLSEEFAAVIQALKLMSDMQRQQGEQLALILQLLTAPSDSGEALHEVLKHLVASNTTLIGNVMDLGSSVREASRALPRQMAEAVTAALVSTESGGSRR